MPKLEHITVMPREAIAALQIKANGWYLDATFGRGGHSQAILSVLGGHGRLYATDRDPSAAEQASCIEDQRFIFKKTRFSNFLQAFEELNSESLNGILLDLGVSSPQLDDASRGFSFSRESELDMRMDPDTGFTAKAFVNSADYGDIVNVIACLGQERFAKTIAKRIIKARQSQPITTTKALAAIVKAAIPARFHVTGRHPATRTFQAIRIHVNDEISELKQFLDKAFSSLKSEGRIVVIAFHSLEDETIKEFVNRLKSHALPPEIPLPDSRVYDKVKLIGRPVRPSSQEIETNPRSRSSIMRIIEKQ